MEQFFAGLRDMFDTELQAELAHNPKPVTMQEILEKLRRFEEPHLMSEEHQHHFEAKYRRVDGKMVFEPTTKCTGCDKRATVNVDGTRISFTFVDPSSTVRYSVVAVEKQS